MVPHTAKAWEDGYRAFFESSADGMLVVDAEGRILDANDAAHCLLGHKPCEVISRDFEDVFDPADKNLDEARERLRTTGRFDGRLSVRRSDGTYFTAEVALRQGDAGKSVVFRDAGEQGSTRKEVDEPRFRALIENARDFVVLADENNVATYASPAVEQILGYTPDEFVGTVIAGYGHPEEAEAGSRVISETVPLPGPHNIGAWRYRTKGGSYRWLEVVVNNRLDDPLLRGIVCNCRDVTDRIEAEEKLRQSEERFRALVENAQDFVVLADSNNIALYASPSIEATMGYTPEEFTGTFIAQYIHPDDLEAGLTNVAEGLAVPGPHTLETIRFVHKDGSSRWLEVVVNNQVDNPALGGVVCNCRDVTERVEAEEKLRRSEEWHRAINENALDFVVVQRPDNTLAYVSPSIERLLGYTPEEAVDTLGADYIHPEDLEWAWPLFYEQLQTPGIGITESMDIRYRHKDGRWRWFESACNNQLDNPAIGGLVFNCRDITERVEAEEKLREAEERYRLLVEQVPAATYIERNDADSSTVYISPRIQEMLGYAPEEWTSEPGLWLRTIHPEDHGRVLARHLRCNATGEPFDEEYRCVAKDGREVWVRDEAVMVRGADGQPLYWQGVKADITARKLAELEILRLNTELRAEISGYTAELKEAIQSLKNAERYLEERERQFHATFERAAVGMAHVSPEGRWLRVNRKLCEVLGYGSEELLKRTFQDITHPEDLDKDLAQVKRLLSGDAPSYSIEKRYFRRDGEVVWANLTVSLVRRPDGEPGYFISVIEDITRRRESEELRRRLTPRDLIILEELARGSTNAEIARDLNYSVNTIKAQVRSVTEKLGVSDRTRAAVYAAEMGVISNGVGT